MPRPGRGIAARAGCESALTTVQSHAGVADRHVKACGSHRTRGRTRFGTAYALGDVRPPHVLHLMNQEIASMSHRPRRLLLTLTSGALAVWVATGCMTDSVAPRTQDIDTARNASAASGSSAVHGGNTMNDGLLGGLLSGGDTRQRSGGDDGGHDGSSGGVVGSILDPLVKLVFQLVKIPQGQGGSITNGR